MEAQQTEAQPARPLTPRRLRTACLDLLGRPPLAAERERWAGMAMASWLEELFGTAGFWENWVEEQLYYFLLIDNFRPQSERMLKLPKDLAAGRLDVQAAIHRIALCSSFDQRNPGADTFVTVVMEQLCGIEVQKRTGELEIGKHVYDGEGGRFLGKQGDSQADVVQIAMGNTRFASHFLAREYQRLLKQPAAKKPLFRWARDFRKQPEQYTQLLRNWLLSEDYDQRLERTSVQPNRMFVKGLFVDLMDRLPDANEARRMRTALDGLSDPGPLRSVLARLMLDSGRAQLPAKSEIEDPTAWVRKLYSDYLGREADEAELKTFVESFHEPACEPSMVVYAILSHAEYHLY